MATCKRNAGSHSRETHNGPNTTQSKATKSQEPYVSPESHQSKGTKTMNCSSNEHDLLQYAGDDDNQSASSSSSFGVVDTNPEGSSMHAEITNLEQIFEELECRDVDYDDSDLSTVDSMILTRQRLDKNHAERTGLVILSNHGKTRNHQWRRQRRKQRRQTKWGLFERDSLVLARARIPESIHETLQCDECTPFDDDDDVSTVSEASTMDSLVLTRLRILSRHLAKTDTREMARNAAGLVSVVSNNFHSLPKDGRTKGGTSHPTRGLCEESLEDRPRGGVNSAA